MKDYYPGNLGGNDRRFSRPARPYDTNQYDRRPGSYNKRNGTNRRKGTPEGDTAFLNEGLQVIKDYVKKISEAQHRTADAQERVAKAEERKADAMEQIATYLKGMFGQDLTKIIQPNTAVASSQPSEKPADQKTLPAVLGNATVEETPPDHMNAADALQVITVMRQNSGSYDKIAEHLNAEGIPFPVGNGKWNRKTVSKFYKESVQ